MESSKKLPSSVIQSSWNFNASSGHKNKHFCEVSLKMTELWRVKRQEWYKYMSCWMTHLCIHMYTRFFIRIYSIRILRLKFVKNLRIILRIFEAQIRDDSLTKNNQLFTPILRTLILVSSGLSRLFLRTETVLICLLGLNFHFKCYFSIKN